jgi:large subunit ribosomal protein L3
MSSKVIIGRKLGMTQVFTEDGRLTPATVLQAGPCPVVAKRTSDADGYDALQLAFEEVAERKISKPERGHLRKAGFGAHRHLREFRGAFDADAGDTLTVASFEPGDAIKVTGTTKGKGFAGTVKRHHFGRGPVTHGSHNVRAPGSIGQSATPSRVIKGVRMAGQMGAVTATQRGLRVLDVDVDRNVLVVIGAVPGPRGGIVFVREDV